MHCVIAGSLAGTLCMQFVPFYIMIPFFNILEYNARLRVEKYTMVGSGLLKNRCNTFRTVYDDICAIEKHPFCLSISTLKNLHADFESIVDIDFSFYKSQ